MTLTSATFAFSSPAAAQETPTIVIGSKNFTENRILGEVMAQLIEDRLHLQVERRINLGGTMVVFSALKSGEIDLYPEYTGTGWAVVLKREDTAPPLQTFSTVADAYREQFDLHWLSPFGFSNSYAIAVHQPLAKRLNLSRLSQLGPHLSSLRIGLSHEFLQREDGWPGLTKTYGFPTGLSLKGMEHGLAYEAIRTGRIDLVDTWTTDGKLLNFPIIELIDDRQFFPPYDCAPLVRGESLQRHPGLRPLLGRLAFKISNQRMQALNAAVEVEGKTFASVARTFLLQEKLLQENGSQAAGRQENPRLAPGVESEPSTRAGQSISARWQALRGPLLEHVLLTFVALLLAIFFGVPLGLWLTRRPTFAGPIIGATGVIQTIPSLALLALMIPIPGLGLGSRSAICALFLYALLPIVRNTFTGVREVDPDLIEAARGMGLTGRQRLVLIEVPLASRTIMAGIRTSAVIGIGVATLAAFIGAGGLGDPIITGLQLNDMSMVLSGAVPAALLAVVTDLSLGALERRLAPKV